MIRIGELARTAGVSVRALRYYEEQGLLQSSRTPGHQRVYEESSIERVRFIRQLYAAGLPSRTVRQLLPCVASGHVTRAMYERITADRARIDARIAALRAAAAKLDAVVEYVDRVGVVDEPAASS